MSFQRFIRALARHKAALFQALEDEDTTAMRVLRAIGMVNPPRPQLETKHRNDRRRLDQNPGEPLETAIHLPQQEPGEAAFAGRWWGVFRLVEDPDGDYYTSEPIALSRDERWAHEEKEIHERLYENLGCRYVVSRVDLVGLVWHPLIHADPRDTHWAASTWFRPVFVSKTPR